MGCRLNRLNEPIFIAVPKPLLTEFGIHPRLDSCAGVEIIGPFNDNLRYYFVHVLNNKGAEVKLDDRQQQSPNTNVICKIFSKKGDVKNKVTAITKGATCEPQI